MSNGKIFVKDLQPKWVSKVFRYSRRKEKKINMFFWGMGLGKTVKFVIGRAENSSPMCEMLK